MDDSVYINNTVELCTTHSTKFLFFFAPLWLVLKISFCRVLNHKALWSQRPLPLLSLIALGEERKLTRWCLFWDVLITSAVIVAQNISQRKLFRALWLWGKAGLLRASLICRINSVWACLDGECKDIFEWSGSWVKNTSKVKCHMSQPLVNEILRERDLLLVLAMTPVTLSISLHLVPNVGFVFDAGIWCFCVWCSFNWVTCGVEVRSSTCLWCMTCCSLDNVSIWFPPQWADRDTVCFEWLPPCHLQTHYNMLCTPVLLYLPNCTDSLQSFPLN